MMISKNIVPAGQCAGTENKKVRFSVTLDAAGQRLDVFLGCVLAGELSREKIKKAIIAGKVRVNNALRTIPKFMLAADDMVEFELEPVSALLPETGSLKIVYADTALVVLNKPSGLAVHPAPGLEEGTLVHRLLAYFPQLAEWDTDRPGIVHRLDKDTSGLLVVALCQDGMEKLAAEFAERKVYKEYLALVHGVPKNMAGTINAPIARHNTNKTKMSVQTAGKDACSEYRLLYADPAGLFSLLAVRIHTGRTHQVRVHLAHLGHPVLGDKTYFYFQAAAPLLQQRFKNRKDFDRFMNAIAPRQLLHAWKLEFSHPETQAEMSFCCSPPEDFFSAALALSRQVQRIVLTGNPACGKSSVLKAFSDSGVPVWSADVAVLEQYQPGADGWHLLKARYGNRFIADEKSPVDKKALFAAMYADDKLRLEVERLIHPLILQEMHNFWDKLSVSSEIPELAVAEVPLYFEAVGKAASAIATKQGILTVGVNCPYAIRAARLRQLRNWPEEMIEKIESWQLPETEKMERADFVLDNSGELSALQLATVKLLEQLAEQRSKDMSKLEQQLKKLMSCPK